jgi:anti-anti-sigma factor
MCAAETKKKKWAIKERQADGVIILELIGQFEMGGGSDELEERLQELIAGGFHNILLECSHVDSIDSSAVGALARSLMSLNKRGGKLKLLEISTVIRAALQLVGLLQTLERFDDEEEAIASFR